MALISLLCADTTSAKCARLVLELRGQFEQPHAENIILEGYTEPDANERPREPLWDKGEFTLVLLFDSTKSGGRFHHDCSREPRRVGIRVLADKKARYSASKRFPADFMETAEGRWVAKEPFRIELAAGP
jgi:hypothetical protein